VGTGERPAFDAGRLRDVQRGLRAAGAAPEGPYVVLHPFAGWSERAWPLGHFLELARRITGEGGVEAVFLASEQESPLLGPLRTAVAPEERCRVSVSPDALASAALIAGADAFVGNDSGPLHLAAWFDRPRLGLFGPAPPALTAPGGESDAMLRVPVECSPCDQRACTRPGGSCMGLLGVEEVHEAFRRLGCAQAGSDRGRAG